MARWLAALLFTTLALASCSDGDPTPTALPTRSIGNIAETPISAAAGDSLVIGVSVDLSGEQAVAGADIADAVDLAIEDAGGAVAGHPLSSRREHDGCNDAEQAVNAAQNLAGVDGLVGVVGPMCTTGAHAANDEYESAGIVHISPTSTRVDLSELGQRYFFRVAWRDDAQAMVQANFLLAELPGVRVVIVDDGEAYGGTLADIATAVVQEGGGQILARERLERGLSEYRALARQVVQADADAVIYEGFDPEGAIFLRDLRGEGYDGVFMAPDSLFSVNSFVLPAEDAAEGAYVTSGRVPDEPFVARFTERFGRAPSTPFVLQAYDAARTIIEAVEAASADGSTQRLELARIELADAVRATMFVGLTGPVTYDNRGDRGGTTAAEVGLAVYRVTNGQFELVE